MKKFLFFILIVLAINAIKSYSIYAHDFYWCKDSLIIQEFAVSPTIIKNNINGDFVVQYTNSILEVRNKNKYLIKLDKTKSFIKDIYYDDNGDIYVVDYYEIFGINEFKKYNGSGWDIIYKVPVEDTLGRVRSIAKDADGNFWINMMQMYFIKYDGEKCTKFYGNDTLDVLKDQDYYPNLEGGANNLVFYKGELYYLGLNNDLCSINPISGERKLFDRSLFQSDTTRAMLPRLQVANGKIWMIQQVGNPASFDGKDFVIYNLDEGKISNQLSPGKIKSFDVDSDGSIWISGGFYDKTADSSCFAFLHYYDTEKYDFYKMREKFGLDQYTAGHPIKCLPNGSTLFYFSMFSKLMYWGDEDQNPLSVVNNEHQFNVSYAYPNPTRGRVLLNFEANLTLDISNATIDVYTYTGQLIKPSVQTGCSFDLSTGKGIINADLTGIPRGFYLLYVNIDGDKEIYPIMKE